MNALFRLLGLISMGLALGALGGGVAAAALAAFGGWPEALHAPLMIIGAAAGCAWALCRGLRDDGTAPSETHGSARLSDTSETTAAFGGQDGLIVGRRSLEPTGPFTRRWLKPLPSTLLRYPGPAHLLTIAPTRSGKGVGAVIPNLLTAKRSILCIDPKGENAAVAADARARFGPVYVLDPFTVSGSVGAAFNPLADLDPQSRDLPEDAAVIADALVQDPPHQTGDAHWNEEAKALIAGVVLHVVTTQAVGERTLSRVRDLLTGPQDQFLALLDDMQANPGAGGLVARAANRHLSKGDREAAGVLSSAQRHTHFLDSDRMSQVMARSDFRFSDLRSKVVTIFLVLPPERLATHARWLRLLVVQALFALARTEQSGEGGAVSGGPPSALSWQRPVEASVLFLLDEFPALGPLDPIRRAFGLMAGYGVQLWVILQDLHQLKSVYGRDYGTFLSNAGLIQIFNVADLDTAAWVSRVLGPATQSVQGLGASTSRTVLQWFGSKGASVHSNLVRRELMTPDEVMRMASDRLILLTPGRRPALAKKVRYFADPEFRGLFPGPSAIHRASASRATAPTRLA